jgi:hypothetical protein
MGCMRFPKATGFVALCSKWKEDSRNCSGLEVRTRGKSDLWQMKLECLKRAAEMADGQRSRCATLEREIVGRLVRG